MPLSDEANFHFSTVLIAARSKSSCLLEVKIAMLNALPLGSTSNMTCTRPSRPCCLAALGYGTNAAGVTSGISEALVSTAMGLVVAIFTLLFANMFRGFYLQQIAFIQEAGGQLELLYRHRYEKLPRESNYAPTR
jgi:MotA/TolQ/ExbB proton channel family